MFIISISLWSLSLENLPTNLPYIDTCSKYFKITKEYLECASYVKCITTTKLNLHAKGKRREQSVKSLKTFGLCLYFKTIQV